MSSRILDIDHLMISVAGAVAAGDTMERLGFVVTPRSVIAAMGLSNRLVCFPSARPNGCNFVEFLAIDDPAKAPPVMHAILGRSERPVSMVMVADDARAVEAALRARGVAVGASIHAKRDWVLPGGETISPEFVVCIPEPGASPLYWNVCQYITPQHYKRAEFLRHPNGAVGMRAVLAIAADPAATARHFAAMWQAPTQPAPFGAIVQPGDVALRLYSRAAAAAAFPGLDRTAPATGADYLGCEFAVADIARARGIADAAGLAPSPSAHGFWVHPARTHGALFAFAAAA